MHTKLLAIVVLFLAGIAPVLATPHIQHWRAPSGARVYFVENHDLPMLDLTVTFAAGSGFDTADKSGLAGLTHRLLDLGAEGLSEDEIARNLADIGAQFGKNFDADRAGLSLRTLSSVAERTRALDIMAHVLQHPLFQENILAREKTRLIAGLKEDETKPESIAEKAFSKAVFGSHPYGLPSPGEVATAEGIQRADIEAFYRSHYSAKNSVVAIMGDVTRAEAEAIAQKLTGELPQGVEAAQIAPVSMQIKANEQRIVHPATQSHILMGAPGMARKDPDYFALYVGNHILGGGGFISRLMHEIREKRGLAYSVYSYFVPMKLPGAYQIGLQTKKSQADEALKLVRAALREFIDKGVTEKELQASKQNIIGGFPLRIDSNKKIVDYLSVIGFYELPLTYLDDFVGNVEKVTVEKVRDAYKRRVNPDAMVTVIVGTPEPKAPGAKERAVQ
jgi:zinc protease